MWLSLICTKRNSPAAALGPNSDNRLRLNDFKMPPCITQRVPVPAQAMHLRNPRRSMPSWLWSIKSSSVFFLVIAVLSRALEWRSVPACKIGDRGGSGFIPEREGNCETESDACIRKHESNSILEMGMCSIVHILWRGRGI